ncbi:HGF-regulated tyrosine kinase substrate [Capsaspora owczarzaki ATCC 30864]|uniref:Hepatocyte growth factor-regulated tyrosine kinase substrate n=1 Tax=Capsaspora owczarzaki (strain ATCC 30864) TaxID=595528 RepID=A0A0D2WS61_CAPO3|nr:HGF-regulated tyrosine kinase substrate [Capsaspora owczarzaki ATCC 30864]KJE94930.1 HGF-regulated tyrosine kinase substrate [Capsaspora owczarzaki ATCC 30864]|eukprot:XP_004346143.2 HGF-regulated tyrosine kinase substrate [Capsaspora owczarzaki ATCC 30864]
MGNFDRLLDQATDAARSEFDLGIALMLCDQVRSEEVAPKVAIKSFQRRLTHQLANTRMYTLNVLDTMVKNCNTRFQDQLASKTFMLFYQGWLKDERYAEVRARGAELLQLWAIGFKDVPQYAIVCSTWQTLKNEGMVIFPTTSGAVADAAMLIHKEREPDWVDAQDCSACRTSYTAFNRRHHCRCCGNAFCGSCSSKVSPILKFGIEKAERVCDRCFAELNPTLAPPPATASMTTTTRGRSGTGGDVATATTASRGPSAEDERRRLEQEEEEFAQAVALSLVEQSTRGTSASSRSNYQSSSPPRAYPSSVYPSAPVTSSAPPASGYQSSSYSSGSLDDVDPVMQRYLNRPQWEQRNASLATATPPAPSASASKPPAPAPSAVLSSSSSTASASSSSSAVPVVPQSTPAVQASASPAVTHVPSTETVPTAANNAGAYDAGNREILETMKASLTLFEEKLQQAAMKGVPLNQDASVKSLFQTLSVMHPRLMKRIEENEELRREFTAVEQDLDKVQEAKKTLDEIRRQHQVKLKQQQEEQEMLLRMQLEQKLRLLQQQEQEKQHHQQMLHQAYLVQQQNQQLAWQQQHGHHQQQVPQQGVGMMAAAPGAFVAPQPHPSMGFAPSQGGYPPQNGIPFQHAPPQQQHQQQQPQQQQPPQQQQQHSMQPQLQIPASLPSQTTGVYVAGPSGPLPQPLLPQHGGAGASQFPYAAVPQPQQQQPQAQPQQHPQQQQQPPQQQSFQPQQQPQQQQPPMQFAQNGQFKAAPQQQQPQQQQMPAQGSPRPAPTGQQFGAGYPPQQHQQFANYGSPVHQQQQGYGAPPQQFAAPPRAPDTQELISFD